MPEVCHPALPEWATAAALPALAPGVAADGQSRDQQRGDMSDRLRVEDDSPVRALRAAAERLDQPSADPAFDAAERGQEPGRGGGATIDGLHATAGNGAVAWLLGGAGDRRHRTRTPTVHAAHAAVREVPVVQRGPDDDDQAVGGSTDPNATTDANVTTDPNALSGGNTGSTGDTGTVGTTGATDAGGTGGATQLGGGAPTPGASWTKVGPPTNSTYAVSGSLRSVATAIAARTEAGSVTTTPSSDTDTYAPPGGSEKVTAARVTVDQAMELPSWTDKANATKGQQAEWDRFFGAITTHENGHVALDKTAYADVHTKMVGQTPKDADAKLDAAEAKAKTDNSTYDTGNDHGLKQGTGINPNIDEVTKLP
jgi:hypothetical protein